MDLNQTENEYIVRNNKRSLKVSDIVSKEFKSSYFNDAVENSLKSETRKWNSCAETNKHKMAFRLDHAFYTKPCVTLAKDLLGKILVRKLSSGELLKGMIVETESYLGLVDKASHSFNGKKTDRNEAMFLKPGTAYVYSIYGMYYCFNISSLEEGSAVLLRAIEPLEGIATMQIFRSKRQKVASEIKHKELCNGPSKLCQSFKIEKEIFNKVDLCLSEDMWLENGINIDPASIISCKRIGIDSYGEEWANKPLRFYIKGNINVSRRCKTSEKLHEEKLSMEN